MPLLSELGFDNAGGYEDDDSFLDDYYDDDCCDDESFDDDPDDEEFDEDELPEDEPDDDEFDEPDDDAESALYTFTTGALLLSPTASYGSTML